MSIATTIMFALVLISAMVAVILLIAWHEFGRPRHALTWVIGFALAALLWTTALADHLADGLSAMTRLIMLAIAGFAAAINTIGFRQRSGLPPHIPRLIGAAGTAALLLAVLAIAGASSRAGAALAIVFVGLMFWLAANTLIGRRRSERIAELLAAGTLRLLALLAFGLVALLAVAELGAPPIAFARVDLVALLLLPATLTGIGLFNIFLLTADLADQTRRLARMDMLTGLLNRRGFDEATSAILASARRNQRSMALVLVDIDDFKQINDRFGHPAGDDVLRRFGECLRRNVARRDLVARIGGEEFAIIFADVDAVAAMCGAEVLRAQVMRLELDLEDQYAVTASFGVAELQCAEEDIAAGLARADAALYRSKAAGRNRATLAA